MKSQETLSNKTLPARLLQMGWSVLALLWAKLTGRRFGAAAPGPDTPHSDNTTVRPGADEVAAGQWAEAPHQVWLSAKLLFGSSKGRAGQKSLARGSLKPANNFTPLLLLFAFLLGTHFAFAQTNIQITEVSVDDNTPNELQNVTFTIKMKNDGPQATTALQIKNLLPANMTFVSATPPVGTTYNAGTGIWNIGALASGQSRTLTIVAYPNLGTSGMTIADTASYFSSTPPDNIAADNSLSVSFTVNRPDILITKTVNDNTPNVGQTILYTIKAKNQGSQNAPATGLVVTDVLPSGLTYVPGSSTIPPGTTYNAGTGAWTIGTLNDNVELTLVLAATVNAGQTGLTKTNTASVTAIDQPEEGNFASTASVNITVNFPDIQMTKTVSNGPYNENTNLTYTVTVKNNGPVTATNVVVKDLLPGVMSYQSHSTTLGSYIPGTGLWTVGTLNSGQDEVLTIVAQPITGSSGTAINNVALLYSMTENDPLISNNSAGVEIEVATVDLLVEKTVNDASPNIGQLIEYSVKLTNLGLGTGTNIIVKDILPPGLTFSSFTQIPAGTTATHSSGTITWTDPTMAPSNQTLKFEVTVDAGYAAKTIVNTAYVEDLQQVDPNPANSTSSVSVIVNGADLALTKTVDDPAPSTGATIVYKIKLRNNGPLAGNDVTISDLLPAGVTYVSHTVSESTYNPGTGVWGGASLDMAIGEEDSLMITATVTAPNGSLVTNTATITSQTQPDDITANNTASVFFVVGNADVSLTKSVNGAVFFPGDPITYTLTITNNGPFQAAGFSVADTLPAGVTFTSASATLGSYNNATGLWTFGTNTLAVGASATLTINATVNTGTAGFTITNTGKAISVQGGNNTANDVATATFKVHGADISVTKTASASTPNEGDPLTYTISVTNNGPDPTTSLVIKDLLPTNLDFVSATGGTYNPVNGEWNIGALANGATVVLTINTTIESGGGITNTAYVLSSSEPDNVTANNTASVFVSALKNFAAGACIINMGQVPQTYNNTLKAYGLVYELVKENMIPVYWAIRPNKTFQDEVNKVDEIDFSVNGVNYRTGAFIIDADYVALAQPIINEWTTLYPTLQVNCNQPAFSAPIFNVITSLPRAVLDEQNGGLIESAFYDKTGLDNTIIGYDGNGDPIYSLYRPDGLPSNLSFCDDIYAMPHADPHTWSTLDKETFDAYIKNGGWLWSACHAPSSLETLVDVPSIPGGAPDMNYLTVDGLVLWGDHGDGTLPYSYSTDPGHYASEAASDPFMQFIGNIDEALQSGSEQIYIPFAAGWRPTTTIAMWDPDHPERTGNGEYPLNAAALVAYGRAYGNPAYGMIVYEASHSVASGTEAENVGAARIYGNFWLAAGIEFQPMITPVAVPDDILTPGELANFALTVTGRTPTFTYQWMSDCGGTFSNPTSATTTFTAPMVSVETTCVIRCVVTDECGRLNFFSQVVTIAPSANLQITKTSTPDPVQVGQSITYTITVTNLGPDMAQAVSVRDTLPASLNFVSATPSTGTWTAPTWSVGNLAVNASATLTVVATVNVNAVGSIINKAYASSNTFDPDTTNNVARDTTMLDLFPVANNDTNTTPEDTPVNGATAGNDVPSGNGGNVWSLIGPNGGAANGTVTMNPDGTYTYTPNANYNGTDVFNYQICDADGDCDPATVTITITPVDDLPVANNDVNTTNEDTPVNGATAGNDVPSGDGGNVWTLVGPNGGAANGTVTMNPDGTYTYTPNANYNGTDVFNYQICDADGDCDPATVTITINPVDDLPVANNDVNTTNEDTPVNGATAGNDVPSGDGGNVWSLIGLNGGAANGTVTMNPDGTYTYTPNANYNGTDVFNYQICDADGDCDPATVTIIINPVDDQPVANNDTNTTNEDTPVNGATAGNDVPSGDGGNVWSLVGPNGGAANGTVTMNPDGTYTYTPNANFNGTDVFTYQICDADGDCDPATVTITVNPVNDPPVAVDDPATTPENTPVTVCVLNNDSDVDGPLAGSGVMVLDGPDHGAYTLNPVTGCVTYTPAANYSGPDTIQYKICDAGSPVLCDTAYVLITVTSVNDFPVANRNDFTLNEDAPATPLAVLPNDDFGGDGPCVNCAITITDAANHGTSVVNNNGTPNNPTDDFINYTPNANFNGQDTLVYQICDANNDCDTALVVLTVTPVNDLPIANRNDFTLNEDAPVTPLAVLPNDDFGGDGPCVNCAITITDAANHGTSVVNNNGTPNNPTDDFINYTPNANYNGQDTLVYQICDANNDCDTALVVLTINPVNDLPLANRNDFTLNEDAPATSLLVLLNDNFGGDGPCVNCAITITDAANNGASVVNNNGTPNNPADDFIDYTPNANFNGQDTLVYQICDANNDCDTALVVLTVTPVNDLPLANRNDFTLNEDAPATPLAVLPNDNFGGDGPCVNCAITITDAANNGTSVVNNNGTPNNPADDFINYTPNANFNGQDTLVYQICDFNNDCDTALVVLTISPVNDLPLANRDNIVLNEDTPTPLAVLPNDNFGGDGPCVNCTITITDAANNGTSVVNNNGTPNNPADDFIDYTPNANYNGQDTLVYQICDANNDCDTALVVLTISPVNDLPDAVGDVATTPEETPVTIPVLTNDTFGGDGPGTGNVSVIVGPANGTVTVLNTGDNNPTNDQIVYTPNLNFTGTDQFTYLICDANGDCDAAIVTVTVTPVNDPPVAVNDPATTPEDTPVTVCVLNNDSDVEGPLSGANVMVLDGPDHGTYTLNPVTGCVTYTPAANYSGPDTIQYKICDAGSPVLCDTAYVLITVTPVNDLPLANRNDFTLNEDAPATPLAVLSNDDFGGDGPCVNCAITITDAANHGTSVVNNNGTPNNPADDFIDYTPNANYNGQDTLVYQICDANNDCDTALVVLTISPVNDLPDAVNDIASTPEDTPVTIPVLTNDTFGGDGPGTGNINVIVGPANGTVTVLNTGDNNPTNDQIVYTPNLNFTGTDQFTYVICDANGDCDAATVTINVTPVNDPPVAVDDPATTPEDTPVTVCVLNNDSDVEGPLAGANVMVLDGPDHGTYTLNPVTGCVTYTPAANYTGPDTIQYKICDAGSPVLCDTAYVLITVTPVNDPPVANDDNATTPEDTPVTFNITGNDTDIDGNIDESTIDLNPGLPGQQTTFTVPGEGTFTVNLLNGDVTFTPVLNFNGAVTPVDYSVCDDGSPLPSQCDQATIYVTVTPVNDPPVAVDDPATTPEDTPVTVCVLNNDSDVEGPLAGANVMVLDGPDHGTYTLNPVTGCVTYTPAANYTGPDTIQYKICDTGSPVLCDTAYVIITVTPVNDLPFANRNDFTLNEDAPLTALAVLPNDDFGGDGPCVNCTILITDAANHGTSVVNNNGTPNNPADDYINYVPDADYNGQDTLVYQICDFNNDCDTALVVLTISPVNDLPVATRDDYTFSENAPTAALPVLTNDTFGGDGPCVNCAITITDPANNGLSTVNTNGTPNDPTDDYINYSPDASFNGQDTLVYQICDFDGNCDTALVVFTILSVNDLPLAVNDATTTPEDTPVNIPVTANDDFGEDGPSTGTITIIAPPLHGTASVNDGGTPNDPTDDSIDYVPDPNYNGPDQIAYEICDANGDCDLAVVTISVTPVNDPPIAVDDPVTTPEDVPVTVCVLDNDSDVDGNISGPGVMVLDGPQHGTYTLSPITGCITYTPAPNYNGPDTIRYKICDTGMPVYCDTAYVLINVTPVNDLPNAINDGPVPVVEDTPTPINVLLNDDFGGDGPSVGTINLITPPLNGTATLNDGGTPTDPTDDSFTYTPNGNYTGPDQFTYQICDSNGDCDLAVVTLNVTPVNDPPVANNDNGTTPEDTPVTICVLGNDTDPDGNISGSGVMVLDGPQHGTYTLNPVTGCITYTPAPNYNGPDTMRYKICDTGMPVYCDTAYVFIEVGPVNDLPDAVNDLASTNEDTPVTVNVLTNDSFGGDGPSTGAITVFTNPTNGTATVNDNGTPNNPADDKIVYTPNPDYNGPDQFTYQICDANGDCDVATVNLTINPVNDPLVANKDMATTPEDTPVTIPVLGNDTDPDGNIDPSSVTVTDAPNHGTATVNPDGSITYTPNANYNGPDTLIYNVCDTGMPVYCDTALVVINVTPVNDLPDAVNDLASTNEDTPVNVPVLTNDSFGGDGPNAGSISVFTNPTNGTAAVNDNGTPSDPTDDYITYTPNGNYTGPDQFTYQICDANGDCDVAVVTVSVNPVNDPPVANRDDSTTPEDSPVTIPVLGNDTDPDNNINPSSVTVTDAPNNGTATVNPDGSITYTPNANYNGPDTLVYQVCDTGMPVLCDTALVVLNVTPVNDPPVANDDNATTPEDTPVTFSITSNDTDTDGAIDPGTIDLNPGLPGQQTSYTVPGQGTFTANLGNGNVTFTPVANFNGAVTPVPYSVCDNGTPLPAQCDQAIIYVTVTPVNDPPVANDDNATTPEDTPVTVCVLTNDTDVDGPLSGSGVMIIETPDHGTAVLNPVTGCITYTPALNYNGPDTLRYKVCDADGLCDTAYVFIEVGPVNDLPDAVNDVASTNEDTPVNVPVLTNDNFGGDGPNTGPINVFTNPSNGTAVVNNNGTPTDPTDDFITYTPNPNYNGPDQFTYQICDANGDCDVAVVTVSVNPVNDPPVANRDDSATPEDSPVTIPVLGNDTDPDNNINPSSVTVTDAPNNGTATVNPDGSITYTPNANYNGPDTLVYQVCDTGMPILCDTALVVLNVTPVNDPPVANDDNATTPEDTPVTFSITSNDTDTDGAIDPGTIDLNPGLPGQQTSYTVPGQGTFTANLGNGDVTFTPVVNFNGPVTPIGYSVCDNGTPLPAQCDQATITVIVTPVNDPPVANDDNATTPEDTPVTVCVLTNDTDVDGPLSGSGVMIIETPDHGTAVLNPVTGCITYTPALNYNGPDTLRYKICDAGGLCDTAYVFINVTPVNDLPDAANDVATTNEDTPVNIPVLTNDTFGGDGPNSGQINVFTNPSNGTAVVNTNGTPTDPADDFITYTPNPNYNGPDQFTYQICDANGDCDVAVVNISVNPVNDPPVANDDPATTPEDTPVTVCVLTNDSDADGPLAGSGVMIIDAANHGTGVLNPLTGCIVYTPNPNYTGPDTIQYKVCDAGGLCDTAYVLITVTPVNDPPVANDDSATTPEDTPVTFNITTNDTDTDGAINPGTIDLDLGLPGQQTSYTVPGQGTFTVNLANGDVTFTPVLNFNGAVAPVGYSVCDNGTPLPAQCDQAIIYVTVTPVNDPPVAVDDPVTTPEDTPVTVCVLTNDSDVDGPLAGSGVMIIDPANHGTGVLNPATGCIVYTPAPNYNGPDTIQYKVCDAGGLCDTAYVIITVLPVNDLPDAQNDVATTPEDTPVNVPVLTNDTFGGDGPSTGTISVFTLPLHGTAVVNNNGTPSDPTDDYITYTPAPNYNGPDQFNYQICDANGDCDVASVTLNITPVNDPPVAADDPVTTPEDTPVTVCVLGNDSDPDGPLAGSGVMIIDPANHGTGVLNPVTGCITYSPAPNYNGPDTIQYKICDGTGLCDTAYVIITVTPVNDLPDAKNDLTTTPEDTPVTITVLTNDTFGGDGPEVGSITLFTPPSHGTAVVDDNGTPNDPTDDKFIYTPAPNYTGLDQFNYEICDANGDCDLALVRITITPVNDPPVAVDDPVTTPEDTPVTVCVLSNDTDVDNVLTGSGVMILDAPDHGTGVLNPLTGCILYTPAPNYNGPDTIQYKVCDAGGLCDTAYVIITVTPVNDLPDAVNDLATTNEDTPVTVSVLTNDTFGGDGPSTGAISVVAVPLHGTAVVNDNGTPNDPTDDKILYTPAPNYNGPDQFTYRICDSNGDCDLAVVNVTINPVNDPPVANDDPVTTPEDTPVTVCVLNNDSDVDGPLAGSGVMIIDPANQGSATLNPSTGCITYTPDPNYNGPDTIQYKICDAGGLCDTAYVIITVTPVNDPPVANDDSATTPEDTPVTFNITANDTDTDGAIDPATIDLNPGLPGQQTSYTVPGQGTFTVNLLTGDVTFTPVLNFNGAVTPVGYSVCDTGTPLPSQCDQAVIYVTVTPVNDPPVANDDPATTPEDTPVTVCVLANDSDVDNTLTGSGVMIIDPANHGTATLSPNTGCITYTPNPNYNGPDTIQYKICDAGGLCDTAYVIIDVLPLNDPPLVQDNYATTPEDTPVTFNITANDSDPDGAINPATIDLDPLTPGQQTMYTVPSQGTFTVNLMTGDVTFTPAPNFSGTVTPISYQVCDNGTPLPAQCGTAQIYVTVEPDNDPPVAEFNQATTPEDTPVTFNITNNDTDSDGNIDLTTIDLDPWTPGQQLTYTIPGQGVFTANVLTGEVTFTPAPEFSGPVNPIAYRVCDTGTPLPSQCDTAAIYVTVTPVNDPPLVQDDYANTNEDTPVTFNIIANDSDIDGNINPGSIDLDPVAPGQQTSYSIPAQGAFTVNLLTGDVTFTPAPNFSGTVVPISYRVCDDGTPLPVECDIAQIYVSVIPVNDPPVALPDYVTTPEDTPVTIPVLGNDSDPDDNINPGSVIVLDGPDHGTTSINPDGSINYTPDPNYNGPDTLTYVVCDTGMPVYCDTALVIITVTPVNDLPLANRDDYSMNEDGPATNLPVLSNDNFGGDGPCVNCTISVTDNPNGGTATVNNNGTPNDPTDDSIDYLPNPNFNGQDTIVYQICDLNGDCDTALVVITVVPEPCVEIEAWVYLEGAAIFPDGTQNYVVPMRTDLNDLGVLPGQVYGDLFFGTVYTPAGQPYNVAPWNYNGTEGDLFDSNGDLNFAKADYPSTVVDWVLVSLRTDPDGTGGPVCQAAALLHKDGRIEFVDAFDCCNIDQQQNYYLVIEHRNHLIVMSHQPISITGNKITYDFRVQQSYINDPFGFGVFVGQKEILPGVFAMYAGNGNQTLTNTSDTDINFDDRTFWEGQNGDLGQYRRGDYNLNGDANFNDRRVWEINNGKFTSVPRN